MRNNQFGRINIRQNILKVIQKLHLSASPSLRYWAVLNDDNQMILEKIALNDTLDKIRFVATNKLVNQEILFTIANNDESYLVRNKAIERILDLKKLYLLRLNGGPLIQHSVKQQIMKISPKVNT